MDVDASLNMAANGMMVRNINNNLEPDPRATMNDIMALIETEIPECQQNLRDNHRNLERVAEYCDTNYFRANSKLAALEETKNYTTQSLASVAYQITSSAFNILHLLDLQATQLTSLESQSNHLAQSEKIHREKVARREIGLFTANKRPNRIPKIIYPANPERPTKYIRKPIDYGKLDDVGHGVKLAPSQQPQQQLQQQSQIHTSRTRSISSAQSINGGGSLYGPGMSVSGASASSIQAPSTKPPTPPQQVRSVGSLSRSSKEYRNPALSIAPPQVPSNYAPNYPINHAASTSTIQQQNLYGQHQQPQQQQSTQPANGQQQAQQYQVGSIQPIAQTGNIPFNVYSTGTIRYGQSPLPPPPTTFERTNTEPDWAPQNFIEKVIALYDYTKEKPDELNLVENAIIYVTRKNEDGWYEGVSNGEEGLFPCNYVELL